jgi:hypothetical protein
VLDARLMSAGSSATRGRLVGAQTFALSAAWLCLFAQASSLLHFVVVEHARCAEHGEVVHAGHSVSPVQSGQPAHAAVESRSDAAAHDHDHCPLTCQRRAPAPQPPACAAVVPALLGVSSFPDDVHGPAFAVIALAPKTSPPVRA